MADKATCLEGNFHAKLNPYSTITVAIFNNSMVNWNSLKLIIFGRWI